MNHVDFDQAIWSSLEDAANARTAEVVTSRLIQLRLLLEVGSKTRFVRANFGKRAIAVMARMILVGYPVDALWIYLWAREGPR